ADIKDFDFRATQGTYGIGARVSFTAPYDYKGKAQSGRLTISLGTGVYPSFFTKHTFAPLSVSFKESMNWQSGVINGQFTLPSTLEPGQTYSVRAKLEAISDYTQETDTDWGVLTITEVAVEHRLTLHASPSAGGTVSGAGTYPHMERVKITAYPKPGWYFDHWGGDFVSSDNPAYVYMSSDRDVTAYFYEEAVEEFTVTVRADPSYGGTVSKSPDKPKYEYGELIRLSCTPASGYYLHYWTRDGEWIESRESFTTGVIRN
ncbi:unnamed protein product, partial [marine sediment metagenome]